MPQSSLASWLVRPKAPPEESSPSNDLPQAARTAQLPVLEAGKPLEAWKRPPVPPQAQIEPLSDAYVVPFQRLNALLLPIPYQASFYKETQFDPVIASLTRIVTWQSDDCQRKMSTAANTFMRETTNPNRQLVAAIRCRLIPSDPTNPSHNQHNLYISTIGTLAPFRGHGLARHLLTDVMRTATEQYGVATVVAHVWEANEDAMEWYLKRGFKVVRKEKAYYRRLAPKTDAWLIQKSIQPLDLVG